MSDKPKLTIYDNVLEDHVAELEQAVVKGRIPASLAARQLVRDFIRQRSGDA